MLALGAAVAVACYTLIGRIMRETMSTTAYTYIVYGGISGVVVGLLLSVFSTILGHSIFSWCLKYLSPTFVSASKLCEPVVAAGFAAVLFGEIPGAVQVVGGAVLFYSLIE